MFDESYAVDWWKVMVDRIESQGADSPDNRLFPEAQQHWPIVRLVVVLV